MFLGQIERHFKRLKQVHEVRAVLAEAKPVACPPPPAKPPSIAPDVPASAAVEVPVAANDNCDYRPPRKEPKPLPELKCIEYKPLLLQRYGWAYSRDIREIAMTGTEGKKLTAPVSGPLYERMATYLAKHKGEEGYPQTQREFLIVAIEHLLVDLDAEARDSSEQHSVEPAVERPFADDAHTEQLAG